MVLQDEVDFLKMRIEALEKESVTLNKKYQARGKALNKLLHFKNTVQKYCGKLTYDLSKLQLDLKMVPVDNNNFDWDKFFNYCDSLVDVRKFNNTQKWLKRKGYMEIKKYREEEKRINKIKRGE